MYFNNIFLVEAIFVNHFENLFSYNSVITGKVHLKIIF